ASWQNVPPPPSSASLALLNSGPRTYSQLRPGSVRSGTQVSGGGQSSARTHDCPSWSCTGIRHAVAASTTAAPARTIARLPTAVPSIRRAAERRPRVHPLRDDQPLRVGGERHRRLRGHGPEHEHLVSNHRRHQPRPEEPRVRLVEVQPERLII